MKTSSLPKSYGTFESKYMVDDVSSKKFLISNFNNYKMVDSRRVMKQYKEFFHIVGQFAQHGIKMDEFIFESTMLLFQVFFSSELFF